MTPQCDPYAPFAQREHKHMSEAEMEAARKRPYPEGFTEWSQALALRAEQRANEAPREYVEPEARVKVVEPKQRRRSAIRRK